MAITDILKIRRSTPSGSTTGQGGPPRAHHVVDVAHGLRPLPTGGSPRVLLTVLDDGAPIGTVELVAVGDPLPVDDQVVAIARQLGHQLEYQRLSRPPDPVGPLRAEHSVAVVVCTRDRPEDLRRCLASILASAREPDEILVVDNASIDDRTRHVIESFGAGVRYVCEPAAGLDRARNRGLSLIDCDIALFTDDDVEVDRDWVERLSSCFDDPSVAAASGLVLPARLDNEARDRFERHAGFGRGFHRRVVDPSSTSPYAAGAHGAGASMAFRADTLRALGGFPEELDAGMPTCSGGDTYALGEVVRAGHRIVYEPAALAFHHHRSTEAELRHALRGYGTGLGAMLATAAVRHRDPGAVIVGVPVVTRYLAHKVARSLLRRPGSTPLGLVAAELRGVLDAPEGFRDARRIAGGRPPIDLWGPERNVDVSDAVDSRRSADGGPLTVSIVIPTRGRREQLVALLEALDEQAHLDHLVEYIVVVDGDLDGSAAAVERLELRRQLHLVVLDAPSDDPHHGNGAGFARNAGAERAINEVLLFLDDDVLPQDRHLIATHLARHADSDISTEQNPLADQPVHCDRIDIAVVGPCLPSSPRRGHRASAHEIGIRLWWADHAQRLTTGEPLDYADFGTGNVSIRRDVFERLGGFANLPRREDWEFGRRLVVEGGSIVAAADAVVVHDADYELESAIRDRFREGRGDAAIAQNDPRLVHWSPLAAWSTAPRRRRRLMRTMLRASDNALSMTTGAAIALAACDRLGLRHRHSRLKNVVTGAAYWAGVGAELGGEAGWYELHRLAHGSERTSVLPLEDVSSWTPPPPATVDEIVVTFGGRPLLVAPVSWGELPWSRTRFLRRVLEKAAPLVGSYELMQSVGQAAPTAEGPSS